MRTDDCSTWRRIKDDMKEPVQRMQGQVNEMLEKRFGQHGANPRKAAQQQFGTFHPNVDLRENNMAYVMTAELPGIDAQSITVTIEEQQLILQGEKSIPEADSKSVFRERLNGRFIRTIGLEEEVDEKRASAQLRHGILIVTIPKAASGEKHRHKVDIESDGEHA